MSTTQNTYQQKYSGSPPGKMLRAMVGLGVLCALLIVLTYEGTLPRVERLRAEALEKAIFRVIPGAAMTAAFQYQEGTGFRSLGEEVVTGPVLYAGYDDQQALVGIAIEASGQGYADVIRILYGYDPMEETVVGFYVLESKETPGLGDKIEKDERFLANFKALDASLNEDRSAVKNKIVPVKSGTKTQPWEVDCITGATISSNAIGAIIGESTAKWAPLIQQDKAVFMQKKNK